MCNNSIFNSKFYISNDFAVCSKNKKYGRARNRFIIRKNIIIINYWKYSGNILNGICTNS